MQRKEVVSARIALNMSLEEFSRHVHISMGTLSRFENGKQIKRDLAERLCTALNIPFREEYVAPRRLKKVRG